MRVRNRQIISFRCEHQGRTGNFASAFNQPGYSRNRSVEQYRGKKRS